MILTISVSNSFTCVTYVCYYITYIIWWHIIANVHGIVTERILNAALHRTVSAVLMLGNMQFKQERNSDQATLPDDTGY